MIENSTTIVLGAGASLPYGYPSGSQLIERILTTYDRGEHNLNDVKEAYQDLMRLHFQSDLIDAFVNDLRMSKVRSIDEFLEHRAEYRKVGKIAIAYVITSCEPTIAGEDPLFHSIPNMPTEDHLKSLEKRWYPLLLAAIDCGLENLCNNKLSIVTFNYDRSLEHFLYNALLSKYGIAAKEKVVEAISSFDIVHVHGILGNLPWMDANNVRHYGKMKNCYELGESGELISIVYEGDRQSKNFSRAQKNLKSSERVVFLGFGYHRSNLHRLGVDKLNPNSQTIIGTRYALTDLQVKNLSHQYPALRNLVEFPELEINKFLREVINLDGRIIAAPIG